MLTELIQRKYVYHYRNWGCASSGPLGLKDTARDGSLMEQPNMKAESEHSAKWGELWRKSGETYATHCEI